MVRGVRVIVRVKIQLTIHARIEARPGQQYAVEKGIKWPHSFGTNGSNGQPMVLAVQRSALFTPMLPQASICWRRLLGPGSSFMATLLVPRILSD